ncbi:hypothetical protein L3Q82_013083, partial [Scortum barcoo]
MEVGDSASGGGKLGWWSLFLKGGPESVFQLLGGSHFSASQEGSCQGTERESADSRPSDSGGTMRFFVLVVEHWTSSIPSTGCLRVYGSLPNQSTCALWIWRRHSTVSLNRGILWGAMQDKIADKAAEMSFLRRVAGRSLRDRVRSFGHSGGARSRAAAPSHREESAEVAWASVSDAPWTPPLGGVPGMSHREEASGKTQDTLEKLCLSAGLGTPRGPLEELEEVSGVREVWASLLRLLPQAPETSPWTKRMKMKKMKMKIISVLALSLG